MKMGSSIQEQNEMVAAEKRRADLNQDLLRDAIEKSKQKAQEMKDLKSKYDSDIENLEN